MSKQDMSVEAADFAEVEQALTPVLKLRNGDEIPVPPIQAKVVIKMFRLSASVLDEDRPNALRLVDFADLMSEFTEAIGDERLGELETDEFMEVYGDFFGILVQSLGKSQKAVTEKVPR